MMQLETISNNKTTMIRIIMWITFLLVLLAFYCSDVPSQYGLGYRNGIRSAVSGNSSVFRWFSCCLIAYRTKWFQVRIGWITLVVCMNVPAICELRRKMALFRSLQFFSVKSDFMQTSVTCELVVVEHTKSSGYRKDVRCETHLLCTSWTASDRQREEGWHVVLIHLASDDIGIIDYGLKCRTNEKEILLITKRVTSVSTHSWSSSKQNIGRKKLR